MHIKLKYGNTNTFFIRGMSGDLEPIEYLAAYEQNDRLKYDWELVMHYAPKKIYYAHANEKIL